MNLPGFDSAQRAYENMLPPEDEDECESGDCDECLACVYELAESQAEDHAEQQREEARLESWYDRD